LLMYRSIASTVLSAGGSKIMLPYHIDSDKKAVDSGTPAFAPAKHESDRETHDADDHTQRIRDRGWEANLGSALMQPTFEVLKLQIRRSVSRANAAANVLVKRPNDLTSNLPRALLR